MVTGQALEFFEDYSEEWLVAQRMRLMPAAWASYRALNRRYLRSQCGRMTLAEISIIQQERLTEAQQSASHGTTPEITYLAAWARTYLITGLVIRFPGCDSSA